jgi:pilus assembly protein CpaF
MQAAPSWPLAAIRAQLSRSIDVIVHVARTASAARQIVDVVEVVAGNGMPTVRPLAAGGTVTGALERRRA